MENQQSTTQESDATQHTSQSTAGSKSKPCASLEEVLAYNNDNVVDRFIVDYDAEAEVAELAFTDMKRWLWMCAQARVDHEHGLEVPAITIFETQSEIDDMWHTFLLFTKDYVEFCFQHFGHYLHHEPTPEQEKRDFVHNADEQKRDARVKEKQALRRANAAYAFDKVGADVAKRWFLAAPRHAHAGPEGVAPVTFHQAYERSAPWETGMPQPQVWQMLQAEQIVGDVLDLGCGTGENAFLLASSGYNVHGIDLVPKAIELGHTKLRRTEVSGVELEVGDVLTLQLERRFDTIVDSGVFHSFSDEDRARYVDTIRAHLAPAGQLHIICFSKAEGGYGPRRVGKDELNATFDHSDFEVVGIEPCVYETRSGRKPAWHCIVRWASNAAATA